MSELNTAATNIYNRLLSAPTFHPASADLFTDWNMQAGDVVTVKSDSDSYQVPIYNMKLKWTGAPKVEVESTGNPEREPLPAIKRREYSANSSNYKEQKSLRGGVGQAQSGVREINGVLYAAGLQIDPVTGVWLYASEHGADYALGSSFKVQSDKITAEVTRATTAEGTMSSRITQTADAITAEVTRATAAETEAYSRITQTADAITAEVARATNAETEAYSRITQTADAITAEVTRATTEEGTLSSRITQTADQIALKVSKGDVSTQLAVECGNVTISGGDLIVSGYIKSDQLATLIANIATLKVGNVQATGNISASGGVTATGLYISSGSSNKSVANAISGIGVATSSSGSIYIPTTKLDGTQGPPITFNIADTQFYQDAVASAEAAGKASIHLSSSWNANNDRLTIGKTTSGNTNSMSFLVGANAPVITYNSTTHKYHATAQATVDGTVRGAAAGADSGTEAYTDGYTAADAQYTQANYAKDNLTRFNNGNSVKLYYFTGSPGEESSKYRSAGDKCWFYSSNGDWDTLYTKSSS